MIATLEAGPAGGSGCGGHGDSVARDARRDQTETASSNRRYTQKVARGRP